MKNFLTIIISCGLLFSACKKDSSDGETATCVAGQGGNVTIAAFPKHHGKAVRPYTAYIKFNTSQFPGTSAASYDLSIPAADTLEDHIHIQGLKCGDYYIYMRGYDTSIREAVTGGIPYTVSQSATGEIVLNVPVTE